MYLFPEAAKVGAAATKLKPGMVIAHDALGVYTPPLKTLLKKNKPVTELGQAISKTSKNSSIFKRLQKIMLKRTLSRKKVLIDT